MHLGPPKTGTTTIQSFLYRARDVLADSGICYAAAGRIADGQTLSVHRPDGVKHLSGPSTAQHLLPWTMLGEVDDLRPDAVWATLLDEIAACDAHTIVVSSEAFSRLRREQVDQVRDYLRDCDVMPVAYLRNPQSRLLSDYTQRVKSGRCDASFSEFVRSERHLVDNYDGFIDYWDDVFGSHAVVIRDFDAVVAAVGLEQDFASLILTHPERLREYQRSARLNVSPTAQTIRMQRMVNQIERTLGRPAPLRRAFAAVRKLASIRGPAALRRQQAQPGTLVSADDSEFIESFTAQRYQILLSRCRRIDAPVFLDAG